MKISKAIGSFLDSVRGLLRPGAKSTALPVAPVPPAPPAAATPIEPGDTGAPSAAASPGESPPAGPSEEALDYLEKVRAKIDKLAADFNAGTINRAQFRSLYVHYQHELQTVERMIEEAPASDEWKGVVTEGQSVVLRSRHIARAKGYAIFENDSGMPVSTLGRFDIDPALLVPMLSSYRAAAREIFGAGTRSTEMEDGRWLCFVPGEYTTMLATFTAEPAGKQLEFLEELHRHFEQANHNRLVTLPLDPEELMFPHEYYLGQWRR